MDKRKTSSPATGLPRRPCTVLVEPRHRERDEMLSALQAQDPDHQYLAFESIAAWHDSLCARAPTVVLLRLPEPPLAAASPTIDALLGLLRVTDVPLAVMCDHDDPDSVAHIMSLGVRASLPPGLGWDAIGKVLALVRAGGTFIPSNALNSRPGGRPADRAAFGTAPVASNRRAREPS